MILNAVLNAEKKNVFDFMVNNMKYIINAPNSSKYITEPTTKILDIKVKEYENFFEVEKYRDIIINYFDNINDFRKFIYKLSLLFFIKSSILFTL